MKIIHSLNGQKIEKENAGPAGFLLTNRLGDYVSWPAENNPWSRYQGWFAAFDDNYYKIVENLESGGSSESEFSELRNNFWSAERKKGDLTENFFLVPESHAFIYELSSQAEITVVLDGKRSYENPEYGRIYEVQEENGLIIVKFIQEGRFSFYLAVKADNPEFEWLGQWVSRFYSLDKRRNSWPFERFVYKAFKLKKAQRAVFAAAKEKERAIWEAKEAFEKSEELKYSRQAEILKKNIISERIKDEEIKMAYLCARHSLDSLAIWRRGEAGILAGLPWFFQFWSRDEAVSLLALWSQRLRESKKILFRHLQSFGEDGRLPVKFGEADGISADASGWLFHRISRFLKEGCPESDWPIFDSEERKEIIERLELAVKGLLSRCTEEDLDVVLPNETWMDTLERGGSRIEMQAFRLNLYETLYFLTHKKEYSDLFKKTLKRVREEFWNGRFLSDGRDDPTIRPNVFLAAYICPQILNFGEWRKALSLALARLWLKWGGLASVDKTSALFIGQNTGEDKASYHNGDSWFWVNNLAALVLFRLDAKRFEKYIARILEASTEEILWQGVIGHHSEISSANKFESLVGAWSQAWSNAMYIEAIEEIVQDSLRQ